MSIVYKLISFFFHKVIIQNGLPIMFHLQYTVPNVSMAFTKTESFGQTNLTNAEKSPSVRRKLGS